MLRSTFHADFNRHAQSREREGISAEKIVECGDVMFDASLHFSRKALQQGSGAAKHGLVPRAYVLATVHRQENTDDPVRLRAIIEGLAKVATALPVVLPLHPRTRARIEAENLGEKLGAVTVIEPVGYLDMVGLEKEAASIVTDSGGVQKEAFFYKVPCVTLRDETEWIELVEAGWNVLVPPVTAQGICDAILRARGRQGRDVQPNGRGDAAGTIVEHIRSKVF